MATPLQNVPASTRTALYWGGYVVGVLGQGLTIIWGAVAAASPDVSMPLALVIGSAILGFLQTQLNLLAGSNVGTPADDAAEVDYLPLDAPLSDPVVEGE